MEPRGVTIQYAIPSRGRAATLTSKTLPLLERLGVPADAVTVFVAPDEVDEYAAAVVATDYRVGVAEGARGGPENRNAILDAYPEGTRVVSVDDDIRDLVVRAGEKRLVPISAWEWEELVAEGYRLAESVGARIWGLYPVPNPYFMRSKWRFDLTYLGGAVTGYVSSRDPESPLRVSLKYKHDFERSLQCYVADGALARCGFVSWRTEGYQGAGGLQSDGDRADLMPWICDELVRRFPGLATLNLTKKSGWPEVRLRDRRRPTEDRGSRDQLSGPSEEA